MKRVVKVSIIAGIILLGAVSGVFAQETAVIRDIAGTVEIKRAGSFAWETARRGQTIARNTVVSTGFRSSAIIAVGSTVLTVRPLSRLTLAEIAASSGTETVNVNLQVGRVRVNVNPPPGTRATMTVRGPSATASVRGTVFEFDTVNLTVIEGTVEFSGNSGPAVLVDSGRSSLIDDTGGKAVPPAETAAVDLRPEVPEGSVPLVPVSEPESGSADVLVTITF
jgi:hypothetical protein